MKQATLRLRMTGFVKRTGFQASPVKLLRLLKKRRLRKNSMRIGSSVRMRKRLRRLVN